MQDNLRLLQNFSIFEKNFSNNKLLVPDQLFTLILRTHLMRKGRNTDFGRKQFCDSFSISSFIFKVFRGTIELKWFLGKNIMTVIFIAT